MFLPDDMYKDIILTSIIPTVDILFLDRENRLLLWLRNNEPLGWIYYILGGRRWKGESLIESAVRKAQEELHISIDPDKLQFLNIYDDIFDNSIFENIWTHCSPVTYIYVLSDTEIQHISPDMQHKKLQFFDLDDAALHPMVQIRIADLKKHLSI